MANLVFNVFRIQKQPPEVSYDGDIILYHHGSIEKDALKNFTKFEGKHLCQSLFLNKVAGLSLLYRTSPGGCFCLSKKEVLGSRIQIQKHRLKHMIKPQWIDFLQWVSAQIFQILGDEVMLLLFSHEANLCIVFKLKKQ